MWGQKAPSKHENGGKKRPQNHKVWAESASAQIRADMKLLATTAPIITKGGQKAPPHKSQPKKCGGKKCRQNAKVGAKSATKTVK